MCSDRSGIRNANTFALGVVVGSVFAFVAAGALGALGALGVVVVGTNAGGPPDVFLLDIVLSKLRVVAPSYVRLEFWQTSVVSLPFLLRFQIFELVILLHNE